MPLPMTGDIRSFGYNPETGTILAGTITAGIYRSTNDGVSWEFTDSNTWYSSSSTYLETYAITYSTGSVLGTCWSWRESASFR